MSEAQRAGGARGGRDQFKWDDVREDKDRELYLGHSVNASKGRWQKGKDLSWYARERKDENLSALAEEKRRVKEQEEDMMRQRLGLAPLKRKEAKPVNLDQHEVKELLKGKQHEEESAEKGDARYDEERIGGIGSFAAARHDGVATAAPGRSRMAPEDRLEGTTWEEPGAPASHAPQHSVATTARTAAP